LGIRLRADGERLHVDAPKGKLPSDLRAQIAERKAEILAYLRQQACKSFVPPPVKPRSSADPAPLSFAQERLWFLEQLEPEAAIYNTSRASRLLGNLNFPALEASLNEIVSRHETLRTAFRLINGQPVQVVQPSANLLITTVDLSSLSEDTRQTEIALTIKSETERPFDLPIGQLLRCTVIRARNDDHVVILTTHHCVSDAWSMGILTRELWTLYKAFSTGNSSPLESLPIQYSDYAVWQRAWLQGDVLQSQLVYWKERLKDLPVLDFPTDRPRKPRQSFCGARITIVLPEDVTRSLNELSARFALTPFMTLLAAFQVLLYRYTGQEDVMVGSPIANRRRPELEGLIGFFVNSLVLRADLSGNPAFSDFLLQVRDTCVGADVNQDLPFEKLVQELQPERDQSRNPLFQVMFVLQNATSPFTGIPGLRIEPVEIETMRSPFDLSLFLRERDGKYIGFIEYSTDLFDRDRIERMAGHYRTLLDGIVTDPAQSIATLPILTEAERHQILIEWNDTAVDYPKDKCIHHLFEEQVERTPEAIAVEFEDQQVTYRELNCRANQLAHYLISLGIGPEKLVGICVARSIEMVVALLGILKAGGAYVPLDPAYPKERLRFMLKDSQVSALLTEQKVMHDKEWDDGDSRASIFHPGLQIICLDRNNPGIEKQREQNLSTNIRCQNLAYVIYTSGSTGKPKGVAIEHRNAANLLHWAKSIYMQGELQGVFASTSICFDLSVFELFVPLSWGGKIILAENALSLRDNANRGITLVNTVPSAMTALLAAGKLPESVRVVNLAGEPLRRELVDQLYRTGTVERVYDLYGPSETTTYSTFVRRTEDGLATIGRPIANTRIYILDPNLQPVPLGIPGEIFIGGAGVAREYLNRRDLTGEKFINVPFSHTCGARLYKTGDVACHLPDGNLEFLGRRDNQVKIRGYRIELGEIETALNQHPAVKDSLVIAKEAVFDPDNYKSKTENPISLVAYLVTDAESTSAVEFRDFLTNALPDWMTPSSFIFLDALPLMPNGKIDRSKLPSLENSPHDIGTVLIPPRTEIEELIAGIWCDVLKLANVGIYDNFFAVGGHSLLATQIVSKLEQLLSKKVPLGLLFDRPTIAGLAMALSCTADGGSVDLPRISKAPCDRLLPLTMNQEHLWTLDKRIPNTHFFNMPYAYQFIGKLDTDALEKSASELVRRHEALRTVFAEKGGNPVQVIKEAANIHLSHVDLREQTTHTVLQTAADWILKERTDPFNLRSGPLLRLRLLRLADSNFLLLATMHHIIGDYWSMHIFRGELNILYSALSHGQSSPLPEPIIQFSDYAFWERKLLKDGALDAQRNFWERKLAPNEALGLLVQNRSSKTASFVRECESLDVDGSLFEELKSFLAYRNVTPFIVILSSLYALMHLCTGQRDLRIGLLVANRRWQGTESIIGHFVNTVVLPMHVSVGMTFEDLLELTREGVIIIQDNQEYPFEALARRIETQSGLKREALFQVLVTYNVASPTVYPSGPSFVSLDLREAQLGANISITACDAVFNFLESSTKLSGTVNYRKAVFRDNLQDPINRYFGLLIEAVLFQTSVPISAALFARSSTKSYFS